MQFLNQSLKNFNTLQLDVKAHKIIIAETISDIYTAWHVSKINNIPFLILGNGSNVFFLDHYYGIVVINRLKGISITEDNNFWYLHVNSGESWHSLVMFSLLHGFFGLENLALIPGTVGSAPIQNIGAYGLELKEVCNYVDLLNCKNNKIIRIKSKNCKFSYRNSIFKNCYLQGFVIIAVGLFLKKNWQPINNYGALKCLNINQLTPKNIFKYICKIRKKNIPDPKVLGNAGSFFKNPIVNFYKNKFISDKFSNLYIHKISHHQFKFSAGLLIEKCNLKGYSIGGASVYYKHALIIVNQKNATCKDIISLFKYIRRCVNNKFNILLEPEVQFINSVNKK